MLREAIATGETVEIAFQNACRELEVESTEAQFEILETPVKKTLGLFGGSPAKVRAFIEELEHEPPQQRAANYLMEVLSCMGLTGLDVEINEIPEGADMILSGSDVGFIIGHRGETLDALQYLASLVANQTGEDYYRITLDVGNYREKRRETLEALGKKMAMKSIRSGRNNVLEPMNPYERRLIHTAVQTVEGAKSWSEGFEMTRHVVIGPADGERSSRRYFHGIERNDNEEWKKHRGRRISNSKNTQHNKSGRSNSYNKGTAPRQQNQMNKPAMYGANNTGIREKAVDAPVTPVYGKIEID